MLQYVTPETLTMRTQSTRNREDAYHRPACGYTSSWRVKPQDAHQYATPETLTGYTRFLADKKCPSGLYSPRRAITLRFIF